jgi:hypothetical protein
MRAVSRKRLFPKEPHTSFLVVVYPHWPRLADRPLIHRYRYKGTNDSQVTAEVLTHAVLTLTQYGGSWSRAPYGPVYRVVFNLFLRSIPQGNLTRQPHLTSSTDWTFNTQGPSRPHMRDRTPPTGALPAQQTMVLPGHRAQTTASCRPRGLKTSSTAHRTPLNDASTPHHSFLLHSSLAASTAPQLCPVLPPPPKEHKASSSCVRKQHGGKPWAPRSDAYHAGCHRSNPYGNEQDPQRADGTRDGRTPRAASRSPTYSCSNPTPRAKKTEILKGNRYAEHRVDKQAAELPCQRKGRTAPYGVSQTGEGATPARAHQDRG